MATSAIAGKSAAALVLSRLHARGLLPQVVDIGPGCGTYKLLMGGFLPGTRWIAVEIWGPYVKAYGLPALYDAVFVADARCFDFAAIPSGGAAVFGDVLEHIARDEAVGVVERALARLDFAVLSVPTGNWPQGEVAGNPWEAHVAQWSLAEFEHAFPASWAGTINHQFNADQGLAVAFLAGRPDLHRALTEIVAESNVVIQEHPELVECGLDFCPYAANPVVRAKFLDAVSSYL